MSYKDSIQSSGCRADSQESARSICRKILFSAIKDKDGKGKLIDVVMPVTELDRANVM